MSGFLLQMLKQKKTQTHKWLRFVSAYKMWEYKHFCWLCRGGGGGVSGGFIYRIGHRDGYHLNIIHVAYTFDWHTNDIWLPW